MSSDRYKYTKLKNKKTGERTLQQVIYPQIPQSPTDIYIFAREGDRLDNLAYKYYGDVGLWWIIAQANHIGKGTMNITPGIQIRIPSDLQTIDSMLEKRNLRG